MAASFAGTWKYEECLRERTVKQVGPLQPVSEAYKRMFGHDYAWVWIDDSLSRALFKVNGEFKAQPVKLDGSDCYYIDAAMQRNRLRCLSNSASRIVFEREDVATRQLVTSTCQLLEGGNRFRMDCVGPFGARTVFATRTDRFPISRALPAARVYRSAKLPTKIVVGQSIRVRKCTPIAEDVGSCARKPVGVFKPTVRLIPCQVRKQVTVVKQAACLNPFQLLKTRFLQYKQPRNSESISNARNQLHRALSSESISSAQNQLHRAISL